MSTPTSMPPASGHDELAAFRAAEADADPLNGLVGAEHYFNAACEAREVDPLTLDHDDLPVAPPDSPERIAAVRDRLHRLAYPLDPVPEEQRGVWDAGVKAALRQFQIEAVLTETSGELTVETWDALQELFNFETPLRTDDWFTGEIPDLTLQRAARLRLSVLGFGEPPASGSLAPLYDDLAAFAAAAADLGVVSTPLTPRLSPAFAETLFAHDTLADRLADCDERLHALDRKAGQRAAHFLVCFAKIELWLHGYDVSPDGNSTLIQPGLAGRHGGGRTDRPNRTADAFNLFFREVIPERAHMRSASPAAIPQTVPELLRNMRELRRGNTLTKQNASAEIVSQLEKELETSPDLWTKLRTAAAKLVNVLFDGVRRVISWLGRVFRRIWDTVTTGAVNLWRAVRHFMGGAAFYFRKAARALAEGVGFMVGPGLATNPCGHAAYSRRVDFDGAIVIDASCEEPVVQRFTRTLLRKSATLAVACRIIRLVCTAVRLALCGPALSIGGFVPMMLGLASVYSQIRELGRMLDALPAEEM